MHRRPAPARPARLSAFFSHPPIRSIPDFAREADFLRLLPRGADIDPNDPRHGNVMRMRGLLAALGLGRRESSVVAHGGGGGRVAVAGLGLAKEGVGGPVGIGGGGGDEEEEAGVFRASQEQQALVFLGKRVAKGSAGAAGRGGDGTATGGSASRGGSGGAFHTFAYNNHRRREEAGWFGCLAATYRCWEWSLVSPSRGSPVAYRGRIGGRGKREGSTSKSQDLVFQVEKRHNSSNTVASPL